MIAPSPERMLNALVVDDNRDAATSLGVLLGLWGHNVRVAFSGPEALEAVISFGPEFILLDIEMPIMHGDQLAETLRQLPTLNRSLIVALSGTNPADGRMSSHRNFFDDYLMKPCNLQSLKHLLARASRQSLE
jgi:two-component system, sensor histidine kinase